ncbi:MAG: hypothetical protein Q7T00_10340, partial [Rugosibacter sp.]|nr:hypothetical protein [Rugosibacter sp.]
GAFQGARPWLANAHQRCVKTGDYKTPLIAPSEKSSGIAIAVATVQIVVAAVLRQDVKLRIEGLRAKETAKVLSRDGFKSPLLDRAGGTARKHKKNAYPDPEDYVGTLYSLCEISCY